MRIVTLADAGSTGIEVRPDEILEYQALISLLKVRKPSQFNPKVGIQGVDVLAATNGWLG